MRIISYTFGLILTIFASSSLYAQKIDVLFFPGLFEYKHQAACYTTGKLKTSAGSLLLDRPHAHLFDGNNVSVCKFNEIVDPHNSVQTPLSQNRLLAACLYPLSWLSQTAFSSFWDWYRAKSGRTFSGDSHFYKIDLLRTDIAGPGDISAAAKVLQETKNKEKQQLVFGVSRGSAAAFIALSKIKNYSPRCAIFESPFAKFYDTLPQVPWIKRAFFKALYTLLPKHEEAAIQFVESFPQDVPVLFVTSEKDTVVPAQSVEALASALAKYNQNVFVLKLKNSSHKGYTWENKSDRDRYEEVASAFLQEHQHKSQSEANKQLLEQYRTTSKANENNNLSTESRRSTPLHLAHNKRT